MTILLIHSYSSLDSSLWFTPQALESSTLENMLTRILAVRELRCGWGTEPSQSSAVASGAAGSRWSGPPLTLKHVLQGASLPHRSLQDFIVSKSNCRHVWRQHLYIVCVSKDCFNVYKAPISFWSVKYMLHHDSQSDMPSENNGVVLSSTLHRTWMAMKDEHVVHVNPVYCFAFVLFCFIICFITLVLNNIWDPPLFFIVILYSSAWMFKNLLFPEHVQNHVYALGLLFSHHREPNACLCLGSQILWNSRVRSSPQ